MYDCCTRMTVLLECFEWTLNTPHNRREHCFNHAINVKRLRVTFDAIIVYYDSISKGCIPLALDHNWY